MLPSLLTKKKAAILDRWIELVLEAYSPDASRFFRTEKDPFRNPVGGAITSSLNGFYERLVEERDPAGAAAALEYFIKIRSVQDLTPSKAVSFVFQLKQAIRENLREESGNPGLAEELVGLDSLLDRAALEAFDAYMDCREKIFEIKSREGRAGAAKLLDRANRQVGPHYHEEDSKDGE